MSPTQQVCVSQSPPGALQDFTYIFPACCLEDVYSFSEAQVKCISPLKPSFFPPVLVLTADVANYHRCSHFKQHPDDITGGSVRGPGTVGLSGLSPQEMENEGSVRLNSFLEAQRVNPPPPRPFKLLTKQVPCAGRTELSLPHRLAASLSSWRPPYFFLCSPCSPLYNGEPGSCHSSNHAFTSAASCRLPRRILAGESPSLLRVDQDIPPPHHQKIRSLN